MSTQPGTGLARFAEVVALLVKQPRTITELSEAMGQDKPNDQPARYINALRAEGLLYVKEWRQQFNGRGKPWPVYAWQPSVLELPDAPRPECTPRPPKAGKRDLARQRREAASCTTPA